MKRDPQVFILHILESIQLIEDYARDIILHEFQRNRAIQDAIIRRLEIIGEAVKNLGGPFKAKHSEIPWKSMAGMRDILIHEYFDVCLSLGQWSNVNYLL